MELHQVAQFSLLERLVFAGAALVFVVFVPKDLGYLSLFNKRESLGPRLCERERRLLPNII